MKLFYDDEFDAIDRAIGESGKPFKTIASHMFPDMRAESAYARLKACCSPVGDQRLTFGQVVRLITASIHAACRAGLRQLFGLLRPGLYGLVVAIGAHLVGAHCGHGPAQHGAGAAVVRSR